jgi:hypothetical protein
MYQKTDPGKASCKQFDTPMGNDDAWGYAWYKSDACISRGPLEDEDDDYSDDYKGTGNALYKLSCNGKT